MAAMALCLVELEELVVGQRYKEADFLNRASFFARLGSGSACRSIFAHCASWGSHESGGSDELAKGVSVHPIFLTMKDSVVLVDQGEKKVSSRAGHGLMQGHLFGPARTTQANDNWALASKWLQDGSWDMLGSLVEEEALTLHAMMMTSRPGYLLMKPESLRIIEAVKEFRNRSKIALYFTLDAGPNVHLLYPEDDTQAVRRFIDEITGSETNPIDVLHDQVGQGPRREVDNIQEES
jgi:diphosphomevalonate decarboxylase